MPIRTDDAQPNASKDPRKRKLPIRGLLFLTLAVAAALSAAVLLTRYMDARVAAARVPTIRIVAASVDIPVATPIKPEWLKVVDWPASARPEGAVSDPAAVVNRAAVVPIARGEPVLPSRLAVSGGNRGGLATLLEEGARAVSVRVDDVIGVAGFIHPGDRVDVIVTMQPRQESPPMSKVVLQNIKVLAVGKELEYRGKDAKEAVPVTVATLMVTSDESERLALSADRGRILLALRGLGDEEFADTRGITPPILLLTEPVQPPKAEPVLASARVKARVKREVVVVPAPLPERKREVEILRGDLYEKRAFDPQERH